MIASKQAVEVKQKKTEVAAIRQQPLRSPCENATKHLLPALRAIIAKNLVEGYGFTQCEAASKLGIAQSAMSKYVSRKTGNCFPISEEIELHSKVLAKRIAKGRISQGQIVNELCRMCMESQREFSRNFVKE